MRLTKKQREALRLKFGGKCAYCGNELNQRWQADHVEPVLRKYHWERKPDGVGMRIVKNGEMHCPDRDHADNLFPSCSPCNNDKHSMTLEQWRRRLEDLLGVCQRNHSAYRHALRFGLLTPMPRKIIFYFETLSETKTDRGSMC